MPIKAIFIWSKNTEKNSNIVKYNYIDINNNVHIANICFLF